MSNPLPDGRGSGLRDGGAARPIIGVIAGQGRLPCIVAEGARAMGHRVVGLGLAGQYVPEFPGLCDEFAQAALLRLGSWAGKLKLMGAREAVMVGRVDKAGTVHARWRVLRQIPDITTALVWYRRLRHDRRSPAILAAVADTLEHGGVTLIDSTTHIAEHMAGEGVMTRTQPTAEQRADIAFAWPIFAEILRLDIGQAMAVKERDVLAVEAIEGTDRMIERAGLVCRRGGWTMLKGARAGHDRRADVPTIGEPTIRAVHAAGGRCISLAAGDVIVIDKAKTLALADELGVAIVGMPGSCH